MTKLTILRGISGSGKSTWAESQAGHPAIVSRDRLRMAVFGTEDFIDEDLITRIEHQAIANALKSGRDVISDNTNIENKYVKKIAAIGFKAGAEVEVKVFDVPLKTALGRNQMRSFGNGRNVPVSVITKQHERFQSTKNAVFEATPPPAPYHGTPGKPKAFLVDIDGTLAHTRNHRGPFDWAKVGLDDVDETIADIVSRVQHGEYGDKDMQVIVMSGRDEVCRDETEVWLDKHFILYDEIFMRPVNDNRPDNIVKAELFDQHIRDNFDVQFVLDDRWAVCEMWLTMGLKVLNVSGLDRGEF